MFELREPFYADEHKRDSSFVYHRSVWRTEIADRNIKHYDDGFMESGGWEYASAYSMFLREEAYRDSFPNYPSHSDSRSEGTESHV